MCGVIFQCPLSVFPTHRLCFDAKTKEGVNNCYYCCCYCYCCCCCFIFTIIAYMLPLWCNSWHSTEILSYGTPQLFLQNSSIVCIRWRDENTMWHTNGIQTWSLLCVLKFSVILFDGNVKDYIRIVFTNSTSIHIVWTMD